MSENYFVYILKCSDGSYYVGYTQNMDERLKLHQKGRAVRHTASRLPVVLVHTETFRSQTEAMHRECQLKRWSRSKKEALIYHHIPHLRELNKSRE